MQEEIKEDENEEEMFLNLHLRNSFNNKQAQLMDPAYGNTDAKKKRKTSSDPFGSFKYDDNDDSFNVETIFETNLKKLDKV